MTLDADVLRRSLEQSVADGWAPALAAAVRFRGESAVIAVGTLGLDDPTPIAPDTVFRIASLGKPFAGVLAGRMLDAGVFAADDPVDPWLPELREHRVLTAPDAPLDSTAPQQRPITVRDLLTSTMGIGSGFDDTPAQRELGDFATGPLLPPLDADAFMARIGRLPFERQPGARWAYHSSTEVLSVLLSRAAGMPLHELLAEQLTGPLGMTATGFWTDERMPTQYRPVGGAGDVIEPWPEYGDQFTSPPRFEGFAGGLVSSAPDLLRFFTALADGELLPPELQALMTTDQLTDAQRQGLAEMAGDGASWGWQVGIQTAVTTPWSGVGAYGWSGGCGVTASVDPDRDLVAVALSQRFVSGPQDDYGWFWRPLLRAIGESAE